MLYPGNPKESPTPPRQQPWAASLSAGITSSQTTESFPRGDILIKTFLFGLALELHYELLFLPHLHRTVIKKLFIEFPSHFHRWAEVKGGHLQQHQSYRCGGNGCIPPQW